MFPKAAIPSVAGRECVDKGRIVGPRSKKENSIHIKNGRGHIKNGRGHTKNGGGHIKNGRGSQVELDGRGRGGAGQKGDERKLVR